MAAQNYVLLERIELNASAASVTFANIPGTGYTDLKIVASARAANALTYKSVSIGFNGLTTNLSYRNIEGGDSTVGSGNGATGFIGYIDGANATASAFGNLEVYIPNYTSANYKSWSVDNVTEGNASGGYYQVLTAGLWSSTAAITSITLDASASTFVQYSTFSLYGLAAVGTTPAIAPKASGGNIIDYDGTYWIHTFLTSGTFTPQTGLTCDVLVVAGGGSGGGSYSGVAAGGGGGAGGLRTSTSFSVSTTTTVTVGAGGSAGASGSDSVFSSITSTGGGRGANSTTAAANGGSGGGTSGFAGGGVAGTGTSGQGFAGGAGGDREAGGGGGASGSGTNGVWSSPNGTGGTGGAGTSNSYSGSAVTYAGGGGGGAYNSGGVGTGGTGGGGNGGTSGNAGVNGTVNLGGGGGGGGGPTASSASNGASGIVIIRYLAA